MNNEKLLKTIYYFLSLACYIVSILFFSKSESNGMGVMWMGFGTILLCVASTMNKKSKDNK